MQFLQCMPDAMKIKNDIIPQYTVLPVYLVDRNFVLDCMDITFCYLTCMYPY